MKFKNKFKKEFKRQFRMALTAAIGFLIAFSWRESILGLFRRYAEKITTMTDASRISLVSSLVVTLFGVLAIIASSELLKEK